MKKVNAIIYVMLLVLMSAQAFALVWQEPYWLPVGTPNPNSIAFGGSATAATGAFSSIDYVVHYRAELRKSNGDFVKVLEEHDVDVSVYTGYETVDVTQADYVDAGNYFVRFTISDSHQTINKQLSLTVVAGPSNNPPVLSNIPDKTVYENHLLQFTISGSDPDSGDTISFSAANLPSGASFNPSTRVFSWTPNYDQAGVYHVTFTVTDNHGATDSQTVTITVINVNRCPVLDTIGSKSVRENELLSFTVLAADPDGDAISYSATGIPSGASFDAGSGMFSWTPGFDQAGSYNVRFQATDGSCPDSETVSITVTDNAVPSVDLSANPTTVQTGQDVSFVCSVTGGDAPVSTRIDFGDGTSSASSTATHAYSTANVYTATCTATDADGDTGSDSVQVTVSQDNVPDVSLDATPRTIDEGQSVSFVCTATGGDQPLSYLLDFGDGTTSTSSSISHVYNNHGVYVVTCTVSDNDGDVDSATVGITVNHVQQNVCPVLNPIGDKTVQAGNTLSFVVTAVGGDSDPLTFSADAPFTPNINPVTGLFSWVPAQLQVGNHLATFRVSDGQCSDSKTITITVTSGNVNHAPDAQFIWSPLQPNVNEDVNFQSTSTDPDMDTLSCSWDFNSDGIVDSTNCAPTYRFLAPGDYNVKLTVSDGQLSDSVTHTVHVSGTLTVTDISCFSPVIEGSLESCSVKVQGNNGLAVGGAKVVLHYLNGDVISPSCVTDTLTGNCMVTFPAPAIGNYTVYATAEKAGWTPDLDSTPRASFQVFAKRYDISNLAVYNDPGFSVEDYDFFRGESMYVHFVVLDQLGNPADNMVTSVALVSPPGGVAMFTAYPHVPVAGNYWYGLQIPKTHDFLGDSQVFTFAFNFSDGSGAEMVVQVVIRNNPPVIDHAVAAEFSNAFNSTTVIDLTPYGSDVEDSKLLLKWSVLGVDDSIAHVSVDAANRLTIVPVSQGQDIVTLVLKDLDDAQDTIDVPIRVGTAPIPQCSDGIDNDGDGKIDQADPGCSGPLDNDESDHPPVLPQCSDGIDNDGDGKVDLADPGCSGPSDNDESDHPVIPQCSDGLDNDGDGKVDMADPGCSGPSDNNESDHPILPQCSDGIDNDGDGKIDMADPQCLGPWDNNEGPHSVPGDGKTVRAAQKTFVDMDDLLVNRISIDDSDVDYDGSIRMSVAVENTLGYDLKDVKVVASIYDWDARGSAMVDELDSGDEATMVFYLDAPSDIEPGVYDVRVVVSTDDLRRVKMRELVIE